MLFQDVGEFVPHVDELLVGDGVVHLRQTLYVNLADDSQDARPHHVRIGQVQQRDQNWDGRNESVGDALRQILRRWFHRLSGGADSAKLLHSMEIQQNQPHYTYVRMLWTVEGLSPFSEVSLSTQNYILLHDHLSRVKVGKGRENPCKPHEEGKL